MFWQRRAVEEFQRWPRTWMGTFTLSPEQHDLLDWRCEQGTPGSVPGSWKRRPAPFGTLTEGERFAVRAAHFYDEISLWFKRLKSGHGEPGSRKFRYLLIAEAHDSEETDPRMKMRPHFHCLLHETEVGALVEGDPQTCLISGKSGEMERRFYKTRHGWRAGVFATDDAFLRTRWELGFTKFQLCESSGSAAYVCAYLTKAVRSKVRNSQHYGFLASGGLPEIPSLERSEVLVEEQEENDPTETNGGGGSGGNSTEVSPASEASCAVGSRSDGGSHV